VGELIALYKVRKIINKIASDNGINLQRQIEKMYANGEDDTILEPKIASLKIERIEDILYLYHRDSDNFVCQGDTLEELATIAKQYKNIKMATVIHDEQVFVFNDGEVRKYNDRENKLTTIS
jgi:hypothetical protein